MKNLRWVIVAFFAILLVASILPSFAEGEVKDSGDPYDVPPRCKPLEPTPTVLSEFWMILMALAFQITL